MNSQTDRGAEPPPLLELREVSRMFVHAPDMVDRLANLVGAGRRAHVVHAVDRVDLVVAQGEVVGLVGESGSGKTTLGRIAAGLTPASSGRRLWRGRDAGTLDAASARAARLSVQMVFQNAFASLNPRMRVLEIIGEAPVVHGIVPRAGVAEYVARLLQRVGLDPSAARRYPHQFSGGQRARIGIARALAVNPDMLVCDEAVAALDVSVQAQVLNLFAALRASLGLTYLFISHDLSVIRHVADRVVVMYLGRIVETGPTEQVWRAPAHPYTRALLAEVPRLEARRKDWVAVQGEPPSPLAPPGGCHFHPRCPHAMPQCKIVPPALVAIDGTHASACHLHDPSTATPASSA